MRIQMVESRNNPNFGVNFINKPKWNKDILNNLEKSALVKEIDEKYSDAFMNYSKHDLTKKDLANDEPNYLASLVVGLDKDKVTAYNINSHTSEGADNALKSYILGLSLSDVEKRALEGVKNPNYSVEIKPVKKQSAISRFISKLFG